MPSQLYNYIDTVDIRFTVHFIMFCESVCNCMLRRSLSIVSSGNLFCTRVRLMLNGSPYGSTYSRSKYSYSSSHHFSNNSEFFANEYPISAAIVTTYFPADTPAIVSTICSALPPAIVTTNTPAVNKTEPAAVISALHSPDLSAQ